MYQKINFLISQPKHMLWVLKRTISMRRFFWAPKTCSNWWIRKYLQFYAQKFCLSKPIYAFTTKNWASVQWKLRQACTSLTRAKNDFANTVKPQKFELRFFEYSLIRNEFRTQLDSENTQNRVYLWTFFLDIIYKNLCFVRIKETSQEDVSFKHTKHVFDRKNWY